jgi:hypothetical protein
MSLRVLTPVSGAKSEHVKVDEILELTYPMAQALYRR